MELKTVSEVDELLQQVFPELDPDHAAVLGEAAVLRRFPAGIDICREGDAGDSLFIIGEGAVDIIVHPNDDEEIVVDSIGDGVYFGEMALLGETTRSATIRTKTPCQLLEISHDVFLPLADRNPELLRRLLRQIIGHLRRNDRAVIKELNVKNTELQTAYAELAENEYLRSQFIATLSHELRTPLTSIRGYLDLAQQGALQGASLQVALGSVTRSVETMVRLTNQMFLLYEMYPNAPEPTFVEIPDVLIEALREARKMAGDHETAVQLEFAPNLPRVYTDRHALLIATRALLDNAFKFNPRQQAIQVRAFCVQDTDLAITITDRGIGVPHTEQERIFEPFYRLEQEGSAQLFPGIGVGLTLARMAVARQNGRITLDSAPDKGSTFTIYLPLH